MEYVICVDSGNEPENFTTGKIYEVSEQNGITSDDGYIYMDFTTLPKYMSVAERLVRWMSMTSIKFEVFHGVIRRF